MTQFCGPGEPFLFGRKAVQPCDVLEGKREKKVKSQCLEKAAEPLRGKIPFLDRKCQTVRGNMNLEPNSN